MKNSFKLTSLWTTLLIILLFTSELYWNFDNFLQKAFDHKEIFMGSHNLFVVLGRLLSINLLIYLFFDWKGKSLNKVLNIMHLIFSAIAIGCFSYLLILEPIAGNNIEFEIANFSSYISNKDVALIHVNVYFGIFVLGQAFFLFNFIRYGLLKKS